MIEPKAFANEILRAITVEPTGDWATDAAEWQAKAIGTDAFVALVEIEQIEKLIEVGYPDDALRAALQRKVSRYVKQSAAQLESEATDE